MNLVPVADLPEVDVPEAAKTIGIRPEEIVLETAASASLVAGPLLSVEYLGADQLVAIGVGSGRLLMRYPGQNPIQTENVSVAIPHSALHFFDANGLRLPSPSDETSP